MTGLCAVGLALLACASCSLDERVLSETGTVDGTGATGGQSTMYAPGAAGDSGFAPIPLCSYSRSSIDQGCETLVDNPGFAQNVAGWTAENVGIIESWVNLDEAKSDSSGSIVVTNSNYSKDDTAKGGTAPGGARQCIPITGNTSYDFAADVYIPAGQGAGYKGGDGYPGSYVSFASMSAFFYPDAECAEQSEGKSFASEAVQVAGEWVHVKGSAISAKDVHSMAVRLATGKPFAQYTFEAHFDNVLVRQSVTQ